MITNTGTSATYDKVFIHDAVMTTAGENAGVHMECMWSNGPNLTVRNSVFRDCAILDPVLPAATGTASPTTAASSLENNIFWPSERVNNGGVHFYTVIVHENADKIDRYTIRNNRFDLPFALGDNPVVDSVFCGNSGRTEKWWAPKC